MRSVLAGIFLALISAGCSQPAGDVPPSAKNETPSADADRQLSQSAAAGRAYGEEMQRQHGAH